MGLQWGICSEVCLCILGGVFKAGIYIGYQGAKDKPKDSSGSTAYSFFFGRSSSGKVVNGCFVCALSEAKG